MCLKRLTNSFRCHLCTESFRRQEWLQNHLQKIHKMNISNTNISQIQSGNPSAFNGVQNNAESVKMYKCAVCEDTFSSKKIIDQHFWEAHQIGQTNIENASHEHQPLNQVHERKMAETCPASNQNVEAMEISTNSIIENEENLFHRVSSSFEFQVAQPKYCTTFSSVQTSFSTIFNFQGFSVSNII